MFRYHKVYKIAKSNRLMKVSKKPFFANKDEDFRESMSHLTLRDNDSAPEKLSNKLQTPQLDIRLFTPESQ